MKLLKMFLAVPLLIGMPLRSFALEPPKIISEGLEAFKKTGYDEALKIWMKGSPLEDDKLENKTQA